MAMSLSEQGVIKSKNLMIEYFNEMFHTLHLNNMNVEFLGVIEISNLKFESVHIEEEDIQLYFMDDHVNIKLKMGGALSGHTHKNLIFNGKEDADFKAEVIDKGIEGEFDIVIELQEINGKKRPIPQIRLGHLRVISWNINIFVDSQDLGPKIAGAFLSQRIFKTEFTTVLNRQLNSQFKDLAN